MTTERDLKWPGHGTPGSQGIVVDTLRKRLDEERERCIKAEKRSDEAVEVANRYAHALAMKSYMPKSGKRDVHVVEVEKILLWVADNLDTQAKKLEPSVPSKLAKQIRTKVLSLRKVYEK